MTETSEPPRSLDPLPAEISGKIGIFIRLCAELEDAIECRLYGVLGVNEHQGKVLLGKSTWGTKMEAWRYSAMAKSPESQKDYEKFAEWLQPLIAYRNVLAHGPYLGQNMQCGNDKEWKPGTICYAFMGNRSGPHQDEGRGAAYVEHFCVAKLDVAINNAAALLHQLEEFYVVKGMREERRQRFLTELRRSQNKQQPKGKKEGKKPPRRSSQE